MDPFNNNKNGERVREQSEGDCECINCVKIDKKNTHRTMRKENLHTKRDQNKKMSHSREITGIVSENYESDHSRSRRLEKEGSNEKRGFKEVTELTIQAVLTPLCFVSSGNRHDGIFYIRARISNSRVVTIQWEEIGGRVGINGISSLSICASIPNLPPHCLSIPVWIKHNDTNLVGSLEIDPTSKKPFSFRFNMNNVLKTEANDFVMIYSGSASWIAGDTPPCIRKEE
jgi:hypothetical protein